MRKMMTEKAARGQVIRTETSPDRCAMKESPEMLSGRKMAGGPTDVSSSLSGAGNVSTYNDKPAGRRSDGNR